MKGRPVSGEEFERMLATVPRMLDEMYQPEPKKPKPGDPQPEATSKPAEPVEEKSKRELTPEEMERREDLIHRWQWFLRGLWWSGLRLASEQRL